MGSATIFVEVPVEIEWDEDYTDEYGGLLDSRRMEGIYDLTEQHDFLNHLAFNAAVNGVEDARRLDGWANIPEGKLTMRIDRWGVNYL